MNKEIQKNIKKSIARRLVIAVVLMSSFITLTSTSWQLYNDYKHDLTKIEGNFSLIKNSHLKSLINSVWVHDTAQISTQLEGLLSLPDMEKLEIVTDDNKPWSVGKSSSEHIIKQSFVLTYLYRGKHIEIGQLHATVSLDRLYSRLKDKIFTILISNGVKTFLVSGFVLFLFNMLVTRHLQKLALHVSNINIQKKMQPLKWDHSGNNKDNYDELDQVAAAINMMQENINKSVVKLQESEKYNRTLFEQSPIGLVLCKMNGELILSNKAYAKIIGCTVEETNKLTYWDITPKKYFKEEEKQLQNLISTHFYGPYEKEYIHKKGHLVSVRQSDTILQQNGEDFIWSSVEDVTQSKQADEQLQMLVNRHQAIISTTQDGFWVTDITGKILEVNDTYCFMSGYSRDELLTMNVSDLEAMEFRDDIKKNIKRIFSHGSNQFETSHIRKNGELIILEVSVSLSKTNNESLLCAFLRDISERRNLEKQLRQSQKMEAIGTLTGGIAHDFNNILAIILGNIEVAKIGVGNSNERLENIQNATVRAKNLVNQLLAFSRQAIFKKTLIHPTPIINDVLKFLRSTIPSSIEIKTKIDHGKGRILADTTQLRHIVVNLCTNAAQAMGENGGLLEVKLRNISKEIQDDEQGNIETKDYVEIIIKDSGRGMTDEVKERIFEPFFTTQSKDKGTGLGMSVVHGAVEECNGSIHIDSKLGVGTTITLYFPIIDFDEENKRDIKVVEKTKNSEGSILFVDDEADLVDVGQQMLEALGYKVETYTDSRKALEVFRSNPDKYNVVITDQVMPYITGSALTKEIQKLRPEIPVFICTGYSEIVTENNAAKSGFLKFFQKPVSLNEYATALKELMIPQTLNLEKNITRIEATKKITKNKVQENSFVKKIQDKENPIRILLVDDDKLLLIIYQKVLKNFDNIEVDIAYDSQNALNKFTNNPDKFDLLIIDYMLPNITGIELAKSIIKINADQNIILWSGNCDNELKIKTQQIGINQCLEKPFGYEDGVKIVKKILDNIKQPKHKLDAKKATDKKDLRLLYIDDEEALTQTVELRLRIKGYKGYVCTTDPQTAIESFREDPYSFDIVITDMNMPFMNGQELAQQILKIRPDIPIFLCSASLDDGETLESTDANLLEIISKPTSFEEIESILEEVILSKS
ncbi:MAG: response regulator [Magnetococcales bacterium]|nr:response regulator [Magnetococcales bacterium]